ncbi:aspartyl/asparaginyl beta-hydroxylase domain-containing protein [Sphingomonas hankyongi]|uniref:Aspartyl/asparaginyl beta-hydroxylase domain-containing protein n=1 Tax=Sphingomonas hankyongi TaxID=2908209 RepID=A0ABT0RZX6_9SPHN|nr:aspartyl/asparaginyl beta-hydroxylase domain-containing protein [Sphingomonas hankyongi]MCL6729121.1 aspartyl/asparaginyl beta-hydroxylase domain-containing protein [Sphingomonas hankyongi]
MRLTQPLLKLPISFSEERLAAEVQALPSSAWQPHPSNFEGNDAVRLVTPRGSATDDLAGPMFPTEALRACPYIMQIMAELGAVWGRSRLMGLGPGREVPPHVDSHYYWRTHLRIHIPVITNPKVTFMCADQSVHMQAGECWAFDSYHGHGVRNDGDERRVHLVLDTVGGARLWDLVDGAQNGGADEFFLEPDSRAAEPIAYEQVNSPKVMSPWEIRGHLAFLREHVLPHPQLNDVWRALDRFVTSWMAAWARFGTSDEGLPLYRELTQEIIAELTALRGGGILLDNSKALYRFLNEMIFINAVAQRPDELVAPETCPKAEQLAS